MPVKEELPCWGNTGWPLRFNKQYGDSRLSGYRCPECLTLGLAHSLWTVCYTLPWDSVCHSHRGEDLTLLACACSRHCNCTQLWEWLWGWNEAACLRCISWHSVNRKQCEASLAGVRGWAAPSLGGLVPICTCAPHSLVFLGLREALCVGVDMAFIDVIVNCTVHGLT